MLRTVTLVGPSAGRGASYPAQEGQGSEAEGSTGGRPGEADGPPHGGSTEGVRCPGTGCIFTQREDKAGVADSVQITRG